ncbi:hypothetical protein HYU10_05465, partial [Candidatus Woesearchaeota archaeon]|nr:hypothetical protein [Candidatus Woesearchaeota archaeon]
SRQCSRTGPACCTPSCAGLQCGQSNGCGGTCPATSVICGVCGGSEKIYYRDADSDGFGNSAITREACSRPIGYVADGTDCDDGSRTRNAIVCGKCGGTQRDCADFDKDGKIDFADFFRFSDYFGARRGDARYNSVYDIDNDGDIDFDDFFQFADYFGKMPAP